MDLRLHRGASTPDVADRFVARGAQVSALCERAAYYMTSPIRNSMKQTATVVRTGAGALNPLNQPTPGAETTRTVPCRAWEETETDIAGDGKRYSVTVLKARIPLDADVLDKDRLTVDGMSGQVESVVTRGKHKLVTSEVYH